MEKSAYSRAPSSILEGSNIPVFDIQDDGINEFSVADAAQIHDNAMNWLFETHDTNEDELRNALIPKLELKEGFKVLMTATGAGNDLPYLAAEVGKSGKIFAQDIAKEMLLAAQQRASSMYHLNDYQIEYSLSDATDLPFNDNYFDAVFHFGGLNLYSDVVKGLSEMDRVAKDGAKVVVGDEGIAPWLKNTILSKKLINNNALYDCEAPIEAIPEGASDVEVSWVINNCFYVISFRSNKSNWNAKIDIPHVGRRGGTIRTRYEGKLEGVTPELRDKFYRHAEKKGVSRVDLLEQIISSEINN